MKAVSSDRYDHGIYHHHTHTLCLCRAINWFQYSVLYGQPCAPTVTSAQLSQLSTGTLVDVRACLYTARMYHVCFRWALRCPNILQTFTIASFILLKCTAAIGIKKVAALCTYNGMPIVSIIHGLNVFSSKSKHAFDGAQCTSSILMAWDGLYNTEQVLLGE